MKTSAVRGTLLFAAGALSATFVAIAGGFVLSDRGMPADEWQRSVDEMLPTMADRGSRLAAIGGDLAISEGPPIKCVWPPTPTNYTAKNLPAGAVDPVYLDRFLQAVKVLNDAHLAGRQRVAYGTDKCWINPEVLAAIKSKF